MTDGLCAFKKHGWRIQYVSGMEGFLINYNERNLPRCIIVQVHWMRTAMTASMCMCVCVCDGSSAPLWHASVGLHDADFNGCLNEKPRP